ncbi:MAG: CdaR family transcriptional regulator [Neobacillus sp.]
MLLPELAEKIVKEVRKLIGEDIIVVNTDGYIIASTDLKRVGTFHEGALVASKKKKKLIITEEDQLKLVGVKAGINFPIFFQNEVIGVIGITGEPAKVTPYGEIIRKMTELLISENYYAEQFDWHSRALESFVMDWIQSKEWNQTLLNRARQLSIDIELRRTVAIIEFAELTSPLSRDIWSSIFKWFEHQNEEVAARSGNERVVLLIDCSKAPHRETIEKRLNYFFKFLKSNFRIRAFAGVGQVASSHEIRQSYRQAERALRIAKNTGNITFDEDLTLEMILDELTPATKSDFIKRTIGGILAEKELVETVQELFRQNHSLKNTANKLHIHINTLHYRLKKIEEITRLDSSNIHHLLTLYLAILFLDKQTKIKE